jgi:hypothetical protein
MSFQEPLVDFHHVDETSSMCRVAVEVADDFRAHLRELYQAQHIRNQETNGIMANVVLAGLTIAWLEAVHTTWSTPYGESALSLLREIRPQTKAAHREMKHAARDFLRRSRWWVRRTK